MLGACVLAWRHRAGQDHVASGCCWQVYSWGLWDVRAGLLFKLDTWQRSIVFLRGFFIERQDGPSPPWRWIPQVGSRRHQLHPLS